MTVAASRRSVPGPQGNMFLGSLRPYQRNPIRFFLEATRQYGPLVHFRFGSRSVY